MSLIGGRRDTHDSPTVEPGVALGEKAVELDPIHCSRAKNEDAVKWLRPKWEALINSALAEAGAGGQLARLVSVCSWHNLRRP